MRSSGSQITYLSILLLVCNEDVYISNIIALLIAKKNTNNFAQDIVSKFEGRCRDALKRLEKKDTVPNQRYYDQTVIDFGETKFLVSQVQRTDYYCKIITSRSVEPIFGQTYDRIAQGIKDKTVDNDNNEGEEEGTFYIGL